MTTDMSHADALTDRDPSRANAEQGLYRKFDVRRIDGSDQPGRKHHDCEYFVLDTTHDQHARAALRAYADACVSTHPELSADLIARYALAPVEQSAVVSTGHCERAGGCVCGGDLPRVREGCAEWVKVEPKAAPAPAPIWRCFHCDEVFTDPKSAALHFGTSERQSAACTIDVAEYRVMEQRMHAYNEEDTELHRTIYRIQARHQTELQREEEKGYARGLADGRKDAVNAESRRVKNG